MTSDRDRRPEMWPPGIPFPPREIDDSDLPPLPPEAFAPPTEEELKFRQEVSWDMEWAHNDPEVQEWYADMIVAVYRRKVVAAGGEWGKVLEEAERVTGVAGNHIAVVGIIGPSILEH
jgi:hypothetical protein